MVTKKDNAGLVAQIEQLRTKWPQAHAVEQVVHRRKTGFHMVFLPGFVLPSGWNKTICTVFWLARIWGERNGSPVDGFYVDLPDLRLAETMEQPHYSRPFAMNGWKDFWHEPTQRMWSGKEEIPGFPQWRELTRFWWRAQMFDPNHETLYTSAMVIRQRLKPAR